MFARRMAAESDRSSAPRSGSATTVVALVIPHFDHVGGMQNYARRVLSQLRAQPGHRVVIVTNSPTRRSSVTEEHGVRVVRLATWLTLSNTPVSLTWPWQIRRHLRRMGVDVVNAHSPVPFLADCAVYAAGRRPVMLTYHSGSMVKGVGGPVDAILRAYERWLLPRVMRAATMCVAVSPASLAAGTVDARLIPPGVDTAVFVPGATGEREMSVAFVGRIEATSAWKGIDVLLSAVALLAASRPDIRVELIGGGDGREALEAQAASLGIASLLRWHGQLPPEGVSAVLQRSGVLVLPSTTESESFGMVLIEAMSCGCPVVASRVGGIPFVIRDGVDGLLVEPGNAEALADALQRVLSDPDAAQQIGQAGRDAALHRWDWVVHEEQTLRAFDALRGAIPAPSDQFTREGMCA